MAPQAPTTQAPTPRTPYFVYGSLMSPTILFTVIGARKPLTPHTLKTHQMFRATLHGHQRRAVTWADFPAVVKTGNMGDCVEGYLVTGLTEQEEASIEVFESGLYTMEDVSVVMGWKESGLGEGRSASVFIWGGGEEELVDVRLGRWDFESFKQSDMYQMGVMGGGSGSEGGGEGEGEEEDDEEDDEGKDDEGKDDEDDLVSVLA